MPQVSSVVTQNYRRSFASSNFGTRKLAFYQFVIDPSAGLVGNTLTAISFRVNTSTGVVTHTTPGEYMNSIADVDYMNSLTPLADTDDGVTPLELPFNITFLGNSAIDTVYIDSNSIIYFAEVGTNNYSREGPNDPTFNGNNVPGVAIANNDGSVTYVYYTTTGTPGSRKFQMKFKGNTEYNNYPDVNLVWEVQFDEANPGSIDFLITQQSSNWNDYDDGEGNVTWGVSDGTNWIDGITDHSLMTTFGDFVTGGEPNWPKPNSLYHQIVRTLQQANVEFFWLGQPHSSQETFTQDWSPIIPIEADAFVFAIADDASSPQAYLQDTIIVEATDTNDYNPGYITLTGAPGGYVGYIEIGMKVTFSGNVLGGLVAGKPYYIVDVQDAGSGKYAISVSATADPNVQDIVYPDGVGGVPGEPVTLTTASGHMDVTFYYYDIEWQGTAGDNQYECCGNIDMPGIAPQNFNYYIQQAGIIGPTAWWFQRLNPTYGLFPGCWAQGIL